MNRKDIDPDASAAAAFGQRLRSMRDERGWTQEELGARIGCTGSHVSAVETGRRTPTQRFSARCDAVFGTGDRFERQGRSVRRSAFIEGFPEYLTHEARAAEIRLFEVGVIPGLLQTSEYATTLEADAVRRRAITPEQAAERVEIVARRQATLDRTPLPLIHVVIDEGCIYRPMGTPQEMRAQFDRLLAFAEEPHTLLQVAPFAMGPRRPFSLPLYILTMPDRSLMSYAESAQHGQLERESASVVRMLTAYHQLQAEALPQAASVAMIEKLRKATL
ncbi:helix-turn-helix domain-containing protein [Streptomyces bohaiensis]|uniref:Helix-turn-helix transcriptional regulator n=1 Tax=Streptomyces bohaiensis TaxID=1431344 RepID=A0ABX1CBI8_9ACTN|nr:helix-turn-helix transcriptional regulator [Streptomyces bohaiensis]NJQ16471.1 helix-turn-helix transcriptional regulator [Streptomyces bohaiensis]